ncbi:TetR family transcriptional regulator [Planosporangium sp. 12N6]|uniref:TetR/AcrR family transcriptional regulator n=1 Tax=Planosporangium spinosum TaxID=3402278 RepID=UPI003CF7D380
MPGRAKTSADDATTPTGPGGRTRQLILDAALRLFRERGYDKTTMRAIADAAGVSVGNAYYYFRSKDHLVQQFYADIQAAHRARAADALTATTLADRLRATLHAGVAVMAPYHAFAGSFVRVAIDPGSPSSPFSPESHAARQATIGLFREVVDGARPAVDRHLRDDLPELLWLAYLGTTLFWVYDRSPDQARTRQLIDAAAPLVARLVWLARLPVMRSVTGEVLALLRTVRS